jgi:predicted transcriptional regulator
MSSPFQDVTDAELAVLDVLWQHEEQHASAETPAGAPELSAGPGMTIREICQVLYPRGKASDYATVQKLLDRLEAKACVHRHRQSPAHVFYSALTRDELIGRRLESVAKKVCGGSLTPLLTHLVQHQELTTEERAALRSMLDHFDSSPKKRTKKKS